MAPAPDALKRSCAAGRLADFGRRWSLEAAHPRPGDIEALSGIAAPGTQVYLTAVPHQPPAAVIEAAARLNAAGLVAVPHIAARNFSDARALAAFLEAAARAGVSRALVIAGDRDRPSGDFADALAVITSGLLRRHGITAIGVGAYPDGHPRIPEPALERALADKLDAARQAGLESHIVTQFCFDAGAVIGWLRRLRGRGIASTVRIGVAGPAGMTSLLRYAARCGVCASARGLARNASLMRGLAGQAAPDSLLEALAGAGGGLGPVAPHYYAFGGILRTAEYAHTVAAGRFPARP